jgi:hypothetical protein
MALLDPNMLYNQLRPYGRITSLQRIVDTVDGKSPHAIVSYYKPFGAIGASV